MFNDLSTWQLVIDRHQRYRRESNHPLPTDPQARSRPRWPTKRGSRVVG